MRLKAVITLVCPKSAVGCHEITQKVNLTPCSFFVKCLKSCRMIVFPQQAKTKFLRILGESNQSI